MPRNSLDGRLNPIALPRHNTGRSSQVRGSYPLPTSARYVSLNFRLLACLIVASASQSSFDIAGWTNPVGGGQTGGSNSHSCTYCVNLLLGVRQIGIIGFV